LKIAVFSREHKNSSRNKTARDCLFSATLRQSIWLEISFKPSQSRHVIKPLKSREFVIILGVFHRYHDLGLFSLLMQPRASLKEHLAFLVPFIIIPCQQLLFHSGFFLLTFTAKL